VDVPLGVREVVWGDGQHTDRQIISATDFRLLGATAFRFRLRPTARSGAFRGVDSAGNGAMVQPISWRLLPAGRASRAN